MDGAKEYAGRSRYIASILASFGAFNPNNKEITPDKRYKTTTAWGNCKITMEIIFRMVEPKITVIKDEKNPDLLAHVSLKLIDEHERYLVFNGFNIRKSKYNQKPYLGAPSRSLGIGKGFFKYTLFERSLWKEIEKEILKQYDFSTIPIINE